MKTDLESKVSKAIRFIKLYKKNIRFIKKRIEIQKQPNYDKFRGGDIAEHQYYQIHIDVQEEKLNEVKQILEKL